MGTVLPFELFGTCRSGVPITFVGLGRMDLTGIQREIGLDRLEQKMVMQNDAFIDLARREGLRRSSEDECVVAHGGVLCINQPVSRVHNSSLSHFSARTRPRWLHRAARNRHRHDVEQASRRWRGGRRGDSARTRRKILIST